VGFRTADEEHGDLLFAGDTLFLDAVARPDLAVEADEVEAMARDLHASLAKLRDLPDETRVAPGHVAVPTSADDAGRYVDTIGALRDRHELLSLPESEFVEAVTDSLPDRPANDARIIGINLGRETVEDATAFDLELGPNNCAVQ
jgi:glyoxylase-like metal-dependent hydrolase (beta-lactamase superfamily II)